MNERIKELLNVCGMPNEDLMEIYHDVNKTFYMQKFAKLIIQECMSIVRIFTSCDIEESRLGNFDIGYLRCAEDILEELKDTFGVEEWFSMKN